MKKLFLSIFTGLIFSSLSFALSEEKHLGIQPVYTLQNGKFAEYVFITDEGTNELTKMSELVWPMDNISYLGAQIEFGWKNFEINGDFSKAFTHETGQMYDFDWLDYSYNKEGMLIYKDKDMCTNRSITDNTLNSSYIFNINVGARITPLPKLNIIPMAGFSYNNVSFYSAVGYMWYGNYDMQDDGMPNNSKKNVPYDDSSVVKESTIDKKYIDNDINIAISYDREWYDFNLGVTVNYTFWDKLTTGAYFYTAPYTYVKSIDHHFSSDIYYLDVMSDNFKNWNFGANVEYRIWKGLAATTNFDFHIQQRIYGVNYEAKKEPKFYQKYKSEAVSGCEAQWWNLRLGLKWNF